MKYNLPVNFRNQDLYNNGYIWDQRKIINDENQIYVLPGDIEYGECVGDGVLSTYPQRDVALGTEWYSGLATTHDKFAFRYGRIDIEATLPSQKGLWPALWLLSEHKQWPKWPMLPEVDIMEYVGDGKVHANAHYYPQGEDTMNHSPGEIDIGDQSKRHTYSLIWDENKIKWLYDDYTYHVIETPHNMKNHFHLLFNLAVGGSWLRSLNIPKATEEGEFKIHSITVESDDVIGTYDADTTEDEDDLIQLRDHFIEADMYTSIVRGGNYNGLKIEGLNDEDLEYLVRKLKVGIME